MFMVAANFLAYVEGIRLLFGINILILFIFIVAANFLAYVFWLTIILLILYYIRSYVIDDIAFLLLWWTKLLNGAKHGAINTRPDTPSP